MRLSQALRGGLFRWELSQSSYQASPCPARELSWRKHSICDLHASFVWRFQTESVQISTIETPLHFRVLLLSGGNRLQNQLPQLRVAERKSPRWGALALFFQRGFLAGAGR